MSPLSVRRFLPLKPPLALGYWCSNTSAVAFVFLGWSVAAVLGMPAGAWLGAHFSWQVPMAMVAVLAACGSILIWQALPAGLHTATIGRTAWVKTLSNATILLVVLTTALQSCGMFTMLAYLAPTLKFRLAATPAQIGMVLAAYGCAGLVGNMLAARVMDRVGPARVVAVCLCLMLCALLLWPLGLTAGYAAALGIGFLWGLGTFAMNGSQQARLLFIAGPLAPVTVALNSSAIYAGQAVGSLFGGGLYSHAGPEALPYAAALITLGALIVSARAVRRNQRSTIATLP